MSNEEVTVSIESPAKSSAILEDTVIENKCVENKLVINVQPDSTVCEDTDTAEGEKRKQIENYKHKKATVGGDKVDTPSRSKHVPHTFLTMPDGKKIMFSLPTKTSNTKNTGSYGERLKHTSTTAEKKNTTQGHGFTQRGIKYIALSLICCIIGILFYLLAADADNTARLLVLLIGAGLGVFFFLCANDYVCR
ncbi:uncharacterized protein LOC134824550 isoform X2 [Bolinopsis microptera]|uniref:uncharacterized protein LOC134824550 isoform X2 n=1 Tax=Bolinopsis microptera TaxID=2820187 RepID=UPI00307999D6